MLNCYTLFTLLYIGDSRDLVPPG